MSTPTTPGRDPQDRTRTDDRPGAVRDDGTGARDRTRGDADEARYDVRDTTYDRRPGEHDERRHDDRRHDGPEHGPDGAHGDGTSATDLGLDRHAVVRREKEAFGGIKAGSAFFGWLAATGMAVILTALLAGAGTALGVATNTDPEAAVDAATGNATTIGIGGAVAVLVILLVAYFCGGYVAGRMARFDGAKQGVAVWAWTVVVSLLVAGISAAVGSQYDVLGRLDAFPRIPVGDGSVTTAGWISLLLAALVSLVGAVLGGLAGMRYHRKVDKVGLGR